MGIRICILSLSLLLTSLAQANSGKYFALYGQYNSYNDLTSSSDAEKKYLSADYSLNLDVRLYRIFILTLHGGQAIDGVRSFYGAGFKVDLPGFFMIGGHIYDLIRSQKRRTVNTAIGWKNYIIQEENLERHTVGDRFSLIIDVSLSESMFLNLDLGLYSHKGDQFLSPSFGLGIEF